MADRIIHARDFEPVVQIGERVLLLTSAGNIFARVTWIEPVPFLEVETNSISPGQTIDREMEEIYVEDGEFAQYRFIIETDNIVLVKHSAPRAVTYYATKNAYPTIPWASSYGMIEPLKNFQLTEFYQYKDESRYMSFMNTGGTATTAKIVFFGYIFEFEEIEGAPEKPYTAIPCVARLSRREGRF